MNVTWCKLAYVSSMLLYTRTTLSPAVNVSEKQLNVCSNLNRHNDKRKRWTCNWSTESKIRNRLSCVADLTTEIKQPVSFVVVKTEIYEKKTEKEKLKLKNWKWKQHISNVTAKISSVARPNNVSLHRYSTTESKALKSWRNNIRFNRLNTSIPSIECVFKYSAKKTPFNVIDSHVLMLVVLMVQQFGIRLVIERSLVWLPAGALSNQLGQLSLPSLQGR